MRLYDNYLPSYRWLTFLGAILGEEAPSTATHKCFYFNYAIAVYVFEQVIDAKQYQDALIIEKNK